ncbi:MAG: hypothetical protein SH868_07010 [Bythopirellula sp.]|nr:hypothetical protein [Bythopirellula sp.]
MEAPRFWCYSDWTHRSILSFVLFLVSQSVVHAGAGYRTPNFVVDAPTPQLAKEIGDFAETYRKELSVEWLGKELPTWSKPCPIKAHVQPNLGAGGATSFVFDRGEVFGWQMNIQGSRERILDSVLPHEITHTIFACHFRQPLPRWADEGACTTVEHESEISKQEKMLIEFLQTRRGIPFSHMFAMKEYPQDVLPLYAQGHSLAQFLISQHGKQAFLEFIADGLTDENWPRAIDEKYGYRDLLTLQNSWLGWVKDGRPQLQLASNATQRGSVVKQVSTPTVVRGQDPASVDDKSSWSSVANGTPTTPTKNWQEQEVAAAPQGPSVYEALSRGPMRR